MNEEIEVAIRVGDFVIETRMTPALLGDSARAEVLDDLEAVSAKIWVGRPRNAYAAQADKIFADGVYIRTIYLAGKAVGFAIRSIFEFRSYHVLYRRLTVILPEYQGSGLDRAITRADIARTMRSSRGSALLASRTRNPIVWFALAGHCSRVAIDLLSGARDHELVEIGAQLAHTLFPENEYDREYMTSKNVFFKDAHYSVVPHHRDVVLDQAFARHPALLTQRDTTFFLGELVPPISAAPG